MSVVELISVRRSTTAQITANNSDEHSSVSLSVPNKGHVIDQNTSIATSGNNIQVT
jgi:hypothetical protein